MLLAHRILHTPAGDGPRACFMHVDRCICHNRTLAELKALAAAKSLDAEGLRRETGCGGSCGLCFGYIRLMLATGQTRPPLMSPDEIERRIAEREGRK